MEKATPVIPWMQKMLNLGHFKQLLTNLAAIHQEGYVHQDVRLENIMLVGEEPNQRAVFGDLGSAGCAGEIRYYSGSHLTASQRILDKWEDEDFVHMFSCEDDLESLFKTFLIWSWDLQEDVGSCANQKKVLKFWKDRMQPIFPAGLPNSSGGWIDFMEKIFRDPSPKDLSLHACKKARRAIK